MGSETRTTGDRGLEGRGQVDPPEVVPAPADVPGDVAEARLNHLLKMVLDTAAGVLGYDGATVTVLRPDGFGTIAATDQRLLPLDDAQYATRSGPCVAALEAGAPVVWTDDGATQVGWETFQSTAAYLGIASSLSVCVPIDENSDLAGSLNFYSTRRLKAEKHRVAMAEKFAAQAAAGVWTLEAIRATTRFAGDMVEAMRSRAVIEQAKGILINERGVDAEQAFHLLGQAAECRNVKLRDLARRVVDERSSGPIFRGSSAAP